MDDFYERDANASNDLTSEEPQPKKWVSFDDITLDQPIIREDLPAVKDGLSCLRPPPKKGIPQPRKWVDFDSITVDEPISRAETPDTTLRVEEDCLRCLRPPPRKDLTAKCVLKDVLSQRQTPILEHVRPSKVSAISPQPLYGNPRFHQTVDDPPPWSPEDRTLETIQLYTGTHDTHVLNIGASNQIPVIRQPQLAPVDYGWGGKMHPGKRPGVVFLYCTIVSAFLSIFCCICTGVSAFVVAIQACKLRNRGKNVEARLKLQCSLGLVVASIFFFIPSILYYTLGFNQTYTYTEP